MKAPRLIIALFMHSIVPDRHKERERGVRFGMLALPEIPPERCQATPSVISPGEMENEPFFTN